MSSLESTFDVFLVRGCQAVPDAGTLSAPPLSAALAQEVLKNTALVSPSKTIPGFLGLTVAKVIAWEVIGRLQAFGALSEILETAYRTPTISVDEARRIAEHDLTILKTTKFHDYSFGPLERETLQMLGRARWRVFSSRSPEMESEGRVPGRVFIYVDRVDGHVASTQELNLLSMEFERLMCLFPGWQKHLT